MEFQPARCTGPAEAIEAKTETDRERKRGKGELSTPFSLSPFSQAPVVFGAFVDVVNDEGACFGPLQSKAPLKVQLLVCTRHLRLVLSSAFIMGVAGYVAGPQDEAATAWPAGAV